MRTDLALAALASAAVPGMKPVAVAGIAPSDDDRARELQSALVEDATGRRWVVRAPLTPVAGARLQRNDELVRQLSRHVPFKVPAAAGYAPVGKDGSAAVYPHVEGSPLDLGRLPAGPGLASAVGRALAAVHNIPRAVFEEQDVPVFDASGARQRAIAEVDRAAETGRVPTGLLARWEEAFEAAPLWQFATTPVHGSFTGASVVVAFTDEEDAGSGRVVAVTDWDEAMVGDPAVDLAELWARTSRAAWDSVLDAYALARAHRPDPYLHARARLVAELRGLRGLARAVAEDDEETARRCVEALRRTDRLTEADDSLVPLTARPSGTRPSSTAGAPAADGSTASVRTGTESPAEAPDGGTLGATVSSAAPGSAVEDTDLEDLTTEVPAPGGVQEDAPPAPAPTGHDQGGAAWSETQDDSDADATMQIPPVSADGPEVGGAGDVMPTDDAMDTDGATPTDDAVDTDDTAVTDDAVDTDHTALTADAVDTAVTDRVTTAAEAEGVPTSRDHTGQGQGQDQDRPTGAGATAAEVAEQFEPGVEQPGGSQEGGLPEPEDLQDEERLQELYGMPAPDHDRDGR